ncbi:MAG: cob(I)yrinic acid a,c-diamide adenosyltransferase [Bacteroidetes bacterium]|nr:MAG: cob(I)yrinic acid a,c-diamide adenosyltransferase [Bacteroidota bacterium]
MKIYTKTGDAGTTSLIGGKRVPKYHIRLDAYGTVDELNSYIGLIREQIKDTNTNKLLLKIQNNLFTVGSFLAMDNEKDYEKFKIQKLQQSEINILEQEIDRMDAELPALQNFILPGGNTVASFCHIARSVCRRAERKANLLSAESTVDEILLKYLNRLSDYLFVLSRILIKNLKGDEIYWSTKL